MNNGHKIHPEVIGLNGGKKQFWLRTHRAEVDEYLFKHGPDATLVYFNMNQDTLMRFIGRRTDDIKINKLFTNSKESAALMQGVYWFT